ncbi:hypothetical protein ASC75_05050 [Aminobacter sp. DSM 101952]|nr:hypothetical protein ASC75_05050 [Aminobacter sp. DSM 101952]
MGCILYIAHNIFRFVDEVTLLAALEKRTTAFTGQLKVKKYSDVELRDVSLVSESPMALGDFSENPPRPDEDLTFVVQYTSEETLTCAFGHPHKRGFVLSGSEGFHHLIGCDCARSRYGLEWDSFVLQFEKQLDRQKSLAWLHRVSKEILDAQADILAAIDHPSVAAFDRLRLEFRKMPDDVFQYCAEVARFLDTWLRGTFKERHLKQERENKERARLAYRKALQEGTGADREFAAGNLKRSEEPVYLRTVQSVMRVPAKTLFLSNYKMRPRLKALAGDLLATAETLSGTTPFGHPDLIAKSITKSASDFDKILAEIDEAISFFNGGTLDRFLHWLSSEEFKHVSARRLAQGLAFDDSSGTVTEIVLPRDLQSVSLNLTHRFRF